MLKSLTKRIIFPCFINSIAYTKVGGYLLLLICVCCLLARDEAYLYLNMCKHERIHITQYGIRNYVFINFSNGSIAIPYSRKVKQIWQIVRDPLN